MPRLEDLPPDLRATLSLLVDRGKSYAQVAELLGIPESAVRDRAHAALDALAGTSGESQSRSASPAGAARGPAGPPRRGLEPERGSSSARAPSASSAAPGLPVSRRGGALLLAGIAVVVIVVVVLLTSGGGSGGSSTASTPTGTSTSASTKSSTSKSSSSKSSNSKKTPTVTKQLTLTSPDPASKAIGIVEVLAEGNEHAFYLAAEHLPPTQGFFYVVWLYNSPTSAEAVSKSPSVGANGRLQGGALLPSNAGEYHQIILTHETGEHATRPGPIVLSGPFSLG